MVPLALPPRGHPPPAVLEPRSTRGSQAELDRVHVVVALPGDTSLIDFAKILAVHTPGDLLYRMGFIALRNRGCVTE
jgi:hypothetical protein